MPFSCVISEVDTGHELVFVQCYCCLRHLTPFIFAQGLSYQLTPMYDKDLDKRKGKLLTFDFNKPAEDPVELTLKNFNRTGFNPHGISVYRDPATGVTSLFVISHRPDAEAVEIFDFERETHSLIHRRTVMDDLISNPNNLHAVGKLCCSN